MVNPWGASAWELLRFVNQKWLKNVVFVLQQADLRDPREVEVIEQHLRETANQKLGFAPPIFRGLRAESISRPHLRRR